jgi:Ni2+-binding GTPase involved in maturation of urease and hydrogenase
MSDLRITIHGPAGSGKTALLKFLGDALYDNFFAGTVERTQNDAGVESAIVHLDDPVALAKSVAKSPLNERRER